MKRFFARLILFISLIVIIDLSLGRILEPLFFNAKSGTIYNTLYGIRDCEEEILIMGDSEVKHGVISNQITDSLGVSCYNLGLDGNNIYYQYAVLGEILERYTPRVIIISKSIASEGESAVTSLFPFYKKYNKAKETILEISPSEKYKLLSNAYAYNSLIIKIIQGLTSTESGTGGYKPLYSGEHNLKFSGDNEHKEFSITTSQRTLKYFEDFIITARSSGCKVVVINTPKYWFNSLHDQPSVLNEIISRSQVVYLDYENDLAFVNQQDLFYDGEHLNHKGAEVLTARFITDLKQHIDIAPEHKSE
jgi:hypothetical protein